MTDKQIIDMTVIWNGEKEFNNDDIFRSSELTSFFSRCRLQFPNTLLDDINKENGTIIINTNTDFTTITIDLKNVSPELYGRFCQQYRPDLI